MTELIDDGRISMIGPIRQEILSGHKNTKQFESLRNKLSAFPDLSLRTEHYEQAARYFNTCREKEVQGSHVDFLICAVAELENVPVFTTDRDFTRYAKHLDIQLFELR